MALSPTVKNAVNAMSNSDKALLLAYTLGVDNAAVVSNVANAFIRTYYPQYNPGNLTADQRALGMMRQTFEFMRGVYRNDKAGDVTSAINLALAQADAETTPSIPLDDIPEV